MLITVMQVFAHLGLTPSPSQSWSVGSRIATMYANETGAQPPKENRPKTSGTGSHCFVLYPVDWQPRIEQVIRQVAGEDAAQVDLFSRAEP